MHVPSLRYSNRDRAINEYLFLELSLTENCGTAITKMSRRLPTERSFVEGAYSQSVTGKDEGASTTLREERVDSEPTKLTVCLKQPKN